MKDYKKILEGVVNIINTAEKSDIGFANICTYIGENCPELKESEDERIRGNIIATIHLYYGEPLEDEAKEMIAWLEKQGKQNLLYVNDNAKEMFIKALERVEEQNNKGYKLTDCDKKSWWEDFKAYTSCIIEQKPAAWSKEDEKQARQIERIVHDGCTQKLQKQIADWFESLKERYTWKPSEEQMNTLEYYMHTIICNEHKEVLFGLYADLKKLMEE